jgi:hypothetical protein
MQKNKKKVAIISSSPLMMMLAIKLQNKGQDVTVFDYSRKKGGAWAWFTDYKKKFNKYIAKHSNAIVPLNKKEEKFIKIMNAFLIKEFKIIIKKTNKKILTNYKFKNKYIYDFSKFYNLGLKSLNFSHCFIENLKLQPDGKVLVNNKMTFNKVFIPSYTGIKKIKIRSKDFKPAYKEIVSEHISILAKKFKLKNFYYSDFYDDFFDRVKIDKQKKFYTLTARLAFKIKGENLNKLNTYIHRFVKQKDILKVKKSKFRNFYRNKEQLKELKKNLNKTNIKYVDTTQFVCGFYFLRNFFLKNKNI